MASASTVVAASGSTWPAGVTPSTADKAILERYSLGHVWDTVDPFLFCVHHLDLYPEGNGRMGPDPKLLKGRDLGSDFDPRNAWKMYHGEEVPGFPAHPHRGFETVTVVLDGLVDHFDSGGSTGRYGNGDVQWMTAGSGLQHSEMFPMVHEDKPNTLDLFQIWINLPAAKKFATPGYKMLWGPTIPVVKQDGGDVEVRVVAGEWAGSRAPTPPDDSWANDPAHKVAILIISLKPGATVDLPLEEGVARTLYHVDGGSAKVAGEGIGPGRGFRLDAEAPVRVEAGSKAVRLLVLQGEPIKEPVAKHGPFVMNTRSEIMEAFRDYQTTRFGGWKWGAADVVHPASKERHAAFGDGRVEYPPSEGDDKTEL